MNRTKRATTMPSKLTTMLLAALLAIGMTPAVALADPIEPLAEETITVYIDFEGYNLGQGFYIEPVQYEVPAGVNAAWLTDKVLTDKGYQYVAWGAGAQGNFAGFYLSRILNMDKGVVNLPSYITAVIDAQDNEWLEEFDYTSDSGWMITLNHWLINQGADKFVLQDGDVIRWQFTVQGHGADLGLNSSWGSPALYTHQDKTTLVRALFTTGANPTAVQTAKNVIINPLATSQEIVDSTLDLLGSSGNTNPALLAQAKAAKIANVDNAVAALELVESAYTPQSWLAFVSAINTIKSDINALSTVVTVGSYTPNFSTALSLLVATTDVPVGPAYAEALDSSLGWIINHNPNPQVGSVGGEWVIIALARAGVQPGDTVGGVTMPNGYYENYLSNVMANATGTDSWGDPNWYSTADSIIHNDKATDNERVAIALAAVGVDVTDFNGLNLILPLSDQGYATWQGNNAITYALIALDTLGYDVPNHPAIWVHASRRMNGVQSSRTSLINALVNNEANKGLTNAGGWVLGTTGSNPDVDTTAMAIQALAPYYNDSAYPQVAPVVDRALNWLSNKQQSNGHFTWDNSATSESAAQVLVALCSMDINPLTDSRFVKNGNNVLDALLSYYVPGGGFKHTPTGNIDSMATDQATYALVAYDRFVNKQNTLYNMSDVAPGGGEQVGAPGSGDLNGDGIVDMIEALTVVQIVNADKHSLSVRQFAAVDMDGDGELSMIDVLSIMRKAQES